MVLAEHTPDNQAVFATTFSRTRRRRTLSTTGTSEFSEDPILLYRVDSRL